MNTHNLACFIAGFKVYSEDGKTIGNLTGHSRVCTLEGCTGRPVPYPVSPGHVGAPDGAHNAEEREAWRIGEMEVLCKI